MKFPELKIVDRIRNNTNSSDKKEFLVVQLDWSEIDAHKISSKKSWYQKFGIEKITKEQQSALGDILNEVNWNKDFLYPSKYKYIFDKYSRFNITQDYYDECLHLKRMAIDEWNRQRPFDTNVREQLLDASVKFVELFFYMIGDAIYVYNQHIHSEPVPPNLPTFNLNDNAYFEHCVALKSLMMFRFWKHQTGGGLLVDKSCYFIKNFNDSIRDKFDKEIKQDLIDNVRYEPLGLSQWYPDRLEQLVQIVNQKIRDNKLNSIINIA